MSFIEYDTYLIYLFLFNAFYDIEALCSNN